MTAPQQVTGVLGVGVEVEGFDAHRRATAGGGRVGTPCGVPTPKIKDDQRSPDPGVLRRARLAAMAQPRPGDSPATAALRAMLRDERLMADVIANVDSWPEPTEEQRETIAALLHRPTRR